MLLPARSLLDGQPPGIHISHGTSNEDRSNTTTNGTDQILGKFPSYFSSAVENQSEQHCCLHSPSTVPLRTSGTKRHHLLNRKP